MPISTNDAVVKYGTEKTLEASGASIANNAIVLADDASYDIEVDGGGAPDGEFVLTAAYGTAPTVNTTLDLIARELNISGANHAPASTATYRQRFIASFVVFNQTATQYLKAYGWNLPKLANYYIYNNATGQTVSAGWTLKVTPRALGPKT